MFTIIIKIKKNSRKNNVYLKLNRCLIESLKCVNLSYCFFIITITCYNKFHLKKNKKF